MVSVLIYLEANKISHRDIKLDNFLLKEKGDISHIKLIDFGLSKDLSYDTLVKNATGTPFYIAPEVLMCKGCLKSDIWSCGVVMYILLSGRVPFPGKSSYDILNNVLNMKLQFDHP